MPKCKAKFTWKHYSPGEVRAPVATVAASLPGLMRDRRWGSSPPGLQSPPRERYAVTMGTRHWPLVAGRTKRDLSGDKRGSSQERRTHPRAPQSQFLPVLPRPRQTLHVGDENTKLRWVTSARTRWFAFDAYRRSRTQSAFSHRRRFLRHQPLPHGASLWRVTHTQAHSRTAHSLRPPSLRPNSHPGEHPGPSSRDVAAANANYTERRSAHAQKAPRGSSIWLRSALWVPNPWSHFLGNQPSGLGGINLQA